MDALKALINRPGAESETVAYIEEVLTGTETIEVPPFAGNEC
jgi:hypothetical protein